jgi:nicotinic acid mononucleotide adenylyltransferase
MESDPPALFDARVVRLTMDTIQISASDLRARVASGRSIHYRTPSAVERYILEKKLYRD